MVGVGMLLYIWVVEGWGRWLWVVRPATSILWLQLRPRLAGSLGSQGPNEASRTRALAPGKQIDRGEQKGHSQNLYNL